MEIELSDEERQILTAAAVEVKLAEERLRALQEATESQKSVVTNVAGKMQGAFRTVLQLKGKNPAAYQCRWDQATESLVIEFIAPERLAMAPQE